MQNILGNELKPLKFQEKIIKKIQNKNALVCLSYLVKNSFQCIFIIFIIIIMYIIYNLNVEVIIMNKKYKIGEVSKLTGIKIRTLQNWDTNNVLKAYRTLTNRRYYTIEQIEYIINKCKESNHE